MALKFKLLVGMILSIVPIYAFISWIYTYNKFQTLTQAERVREYVTLFPGFMQEVNTISWLSTILSLASIITLGSIKKLRSSLNVTKVLYMAALAFILFFNIWSFL